MGKKFKAYAIVIYCIIDTCYLNDGDLFLYEIWLSTVENQDYLRRSTST